MVLILVTGAQKSGKSRYAEQRAMALSDRPCYLATARKWDEEFIARIARHQSERNASWINLEQEVDLAQHAYMGNALVLDCITLWLTNIFTDVEYDGDIALARAKLLWRDFIAKTPATIIAVGNEIGWGLHAETKMGRQFVDLQGSMMQHIARQADEVVLMVAGLPLRVK